MNIRTGVAALALVGCVALTAGCKSENATGSGTPAAAGGAGNATAPTAGSAAEELTAAAAATGRTSFRFTVKSVAGASIEGSADPVARTSVSSLSMQTGGAGAKLEMVMISDDIYMKLPRELAGALGGGKWLHLDSAKMKAGGSFGVRDPSDPTGSAAFARTATSVEKTGNGTYRGTLDLTKMPRYSESKQFTVLGDAAKAVPFQATVDGQGRLATMKVEMKAQSVDATTEITYSDYGTKVQATKPPAAETTEAPEALYNTLGA